MSLLQPTFEECLPQINIELSKRKHKWTLTAIPWMDWEDVSQIIRLHIFEKWDKYDPARPLVRWINTIITNQIRNVIRNYYGNYTRPCLKCAAAEGEDGCRIYNKQCSDCPLFKFWEKKRKPAFNSKLPVSIENHTQEVFDMFNKVLDIEKTAGELHKHMETILKPLEWTVYKHLYINDGKEDEVAKLIGYKTKEKNRSAGYKTIKLLKKSIIAKVKKALYNNEIDY